MLGWIKSLERAQISAVKTETVRVAPARKPYQPDPDFVNLDEQVRRFTNGLTPAQRAGEFMMADILLNLKGRWAALPHNSHVSRSLVRLGWSKGRLESSRSLPCRRVWFPPPISKV